MEEESGIEETLLDPSKKQELDEDGTAFSARHKRETFQKFWTKDKTEALLRILAAQAEQGDVDHGKVGSRKFRQVLSFGAGNFALHPFLSSDLLKE